MPTAPFDAAIVFHPTADLEATSRFYGEVLGLPLVLDRGDARVFRAAADGYVGFRRGTPGPSPAGVVVSLVTDDVVGWHRRLLERGAVFERGPQHEDARGLRRALLRDPNGYLVGIQAFDDLAWSLPDAD